MASFIIYAFLWAPVKTEGESHGVDVCMHQRLKHTKLYKDLFKKGLLMVQNTFRVMERKFWIALILA